MSRKTIIGRPGALRFASVFACASLPFYGGSLLAQDQAADEEVLEEIVVTGTQIKGARISDALPVSVVNSADIEAIGVDSGDQLLEFMAEQGMNYFSESENISGGVNSARGDVGAFNLRNLGTGNTLVLLNGRRMVNAASYQTEAVGGSFIPVNTVNSQTLPVFGLERVEVLRDGASAIYGADAVAGVVNYVLKKDFEGFSIRTRFSAYDGLPRNDHRITLEWGKNFNDGRTNLSIFADYYRRDRVNAQDDAKWADSDFMRLLPEGSPWLEVSSFNNTSAHSEYGQYDVTTSVAGMGLTGIIWDGAGEFETYPAGDPRCQWDLGYGTCGAVDGQGTYRYNNNENRDLYSALDRINVYAFLNHEFDSGLEAFTEFSIYASYTNTLRHASMKLGAVAPYVVPATNYWNPFGVCGNPNRLPEDVLGTEVPCTGLDLTMDFYRWAHVPRSVDNDGTAFRFLQGLRGSIGEWDWESAVTWSLAEKEDITHNRISNVLLTEALADPTPAAFNPFSGRVNSNIERILIDVRRDNETRLKMFDFKVSRNDLFELPAGPVGVLGGIEFRNESFIDDRDPRLDGTINYVDNAGLTYPYVSDVMNSSPSSDSRGSRDVTSLFTEFSIPVLDSLDVQAAIRYEDFSDIGDTTVGKFAFGWRPIDMLLIRGSWSEAFRVPNLITVNEGDVARSNTRDDYACFYADPTQSVLDCNYSMQRLAAGSEFLVPEKSDNTNIGVVFEPLEGLTITVDFWEIDKKNTIGLFGEENHTALDLLYRLEAGTSNCAAVAGNPAVLRADPSTLSQDEQQVYLDAGLCPMGEVQQVDDLYANLDRRIVRGHDIGVYYSFETGFGDFDIRYVASFLDKYEQVAGGDAAVLIEAQENGDLPASVPVVGFADLIRQDGNPEQKHTLRVTWRKGDWGAALSGVRVSDFIETDLTLEDDNGNPLYWVLPDMTTWNASVDYRFDAFMDTSARIRLGINNLTDERAPLSDSNFGYLADVHSDLGTSYYVDFQLGF
jgi:outer membrane receptor protein involved in Fe transport